MNDTALIAAGTPGSVTSTIGGPGGQGAVEFWPPLVDPSPNGLFSVTHWVQDETVDEPARFLVDGTNVRNFNYGGVSSSGVWNQPWCQPSPYPPPQTKTGTRPPIPAFYEPTVAWAYDACDLSEYSVAEIKRNAAQWLRLTSTVSVEQAVATRLLADAGSLPVAADFLIAMGEIDVAIGATGALGFIHASPALAPTASYFNAVVRTPGDPVLRTPLGHIWIFGGGYADVLSDTAGNIMVATSQPFGWRNAPQMLTTVYQQQNQYIAVAEQSFVIGYEALIGVAIAQIM